MVIRYPGILARVFFWDFRENKNPLSDTIFFNLNV